MNCRDCEDYVPPGDEYQCISCGCCLCDFCAPICEGCDEEGDEDE